MCLAYSCQSQMDSSTKVASTYFCNAQKSLPLNGECNSQLIINLTKHEHMKINILIF